MKNGNSLIGLFHGIFEGHILTFNPGQDENAKNIEKFDDVRDIKRELKSKGIKLITEVDEEISGPGPILESSQIQWVGVISIPQLKDFLNFIWLYQIIH